MCPDIYAEQEQRQNKTITKREQMSEDKSKINNTSINYTIVLYSILKIKE